PVGGVVEEGDGGGLRGVEAGPEGGVGEAGVGVLVTLGGVLGGAGGAGGGGEPGGVPCKCGGACGDAVRRAPGPGQRRSQPFPVQAFAVAHPGRGRHGGLLAGGAAQRVFLFGAAQFLLGGVQRRRGVPGPAVLLLQLGEGLGELSGGGVPGLGAGGGQVLAEFRQAAFVAGAAFLGGPVLRQGALLRLAADVAGVLAGGGGVFGGAADGARGALGEVRGEFGGDAVEALFLEVEPVVAGPGGGLGGVQGGPAGVLGAGGEFVALPGGGQPPAGGVALSGELARPCGGLLGGLDGGPQSVAGLFPPGEPGLGLLQGLGVGAFLAVQAGALVEEAGET